MLSNTPLVFADESDEEEAPPVVVAKTPANRAVVQGNIYIPSKTPVEVELVKTVSSKTHRKGDIIDIRVTENLIINGVIIIPKGALGEAVVTLGRKAGGFGRRGKLIVTPQFVRAANGMKIPLIQDDFQSLGKGDGGGAVAVAATVTIIGGIFMKGTNTTFEAGTDFTVSVDGDIDLGCAEDNLAEEMNPRKVRGNEIIVAPK
jgi:hypothetical protein